MGYGQFWRYVRTCPGHFWPKLLGFTYVSIFEYLILSARFEEKSVFIQSLVVFVSGIIISGTVYARYGLPATI